MAVNIESINFSDYFKKICENNLSLKTNYDKELIKDSNEIGEKIINTLSSFFGVDNNLFKYQFDGMFKTPALIPWLGFYFNSEYKDLMFDIFFNVYEKKVYFSINYNVEKINSKKTLLKIKEKLRTDNIFNFNYDSKWPKDDKILAEQKVILRGNKNVFSSLYFDYVECENNHEIIRIFKKFSKIIRHIYSVLKNNIDLLFFLDKYSLIEENKNKLTPYLISEKINSVNIIEKEKHEKILEEKKRVGKSAEEVVKEYEKNFLREKGLCELAKKVSIVKDDGLGYDVLSFNDDGSKKFIEVKGTKKNKSPYTFYLSKNEFNLIKEHNYLIYIVTKVEERKPSINIFTIDEIEKYLVTESYKFGMK